LPIMNGLYGWHTNGEIGTLDLVGMCQWAELV
jgi:hypothetical protein